MTALHLEAFVEEASAKAALLELIPRIRSDLTFTIHSFGGKQDLLANLPARLRAMARWMPDHFRIVVLVDLDSGDCVKLKRKLEATAHLAGLRTPGRKAVGPIQVLNRIAIEELEAWFLGDTQAIAAAYPGVPENLDTRRGYRDPDAIRGGTWEALERELQKAGFFRGGLAKIQAARAIAAHMDPARNRSRSFGVFRDGLLAL